MVRTRAGGPLGEDEDELALPDIPRPTGETASEAPEVVRWVRFAVLPLEVDEERRVVRAA